VPPEVEAHHTDHPEHPRGRTRLTPVISVLVACVALASALGGPGPSYAEEPDRKDAKRAGGVCSVLAAGDIMLAGSAKGCLKDKGYDHAFGDRGLAELITSSQVSFANLEYPVTARGVRYQDKQYAFRGEPESLSAIRKAGFDLLSLANNHIMDYGERGLRDTLRECRKNGLACAGAGMDLASASRLAVVKRNRITYGLLAYSMTFPEEFWAGVEKPGTAHPDRAQVQQDITQARARVDILMVSFHWGQELKSEPKPYQIDFAHHAIDSGADLVVGHHPHVPQGIEIYRGRPVFYSLGNYAFGAVSENAGMSFVAVTRFRGMVPVKVTLYPVNVRNKEVGFQPRLAKGASARGIIQHLKDISGAFGTDISCQDSTGRIAIPQTGHEPPLAVSK